MGTHTRMVVHFETIDFKASAGPTARSSIGTGRNEPRRANPPAIRKGFQLRSRLCVTSGIRVLRSSGWPELYRYHTSASGRGSIRPVLHWQLVRGAHKTIQQRKQLFPLLPIGAIKCASLRKHSKRIRVRLIWPSEPEWSSPVIRNHLWRFRGRSWLSSSR